MENEKPVFNFPNATNVPEKIEVVYLTGKSQDHLPHPQSSNFLITIASLVAMVGSKSFAQDPANNTHVVTYSKTNTKKRIVLTTDPTIQRRDTFTAELIINPDLVAFGLNGGRNFRHEELVNFVRKYAYCFGDLQSAKDLIKSLRNFEVKFEQTIAREDDRQGNKKDLVESAIKFNKGEIPVVWDLYMPLYIGTEKVRFSIEVEIEKQDSQPVFSFHSLDMQVAAEDVANTQIDNAIETLSKYFVCLEEVK